MQAAVGRLDLGEVCLRSLHMAKVSSAFTDIEIRLVIYGGVLSVLCIIYMLRIEMTYAAAYHLRAEGCVCGYVPIQRISSA